MIAFFVPLIYPCTIGGMEIYYYHLINELSKTQKVLLFTTCKHYKNNNCRKIHVSSNLFFIKRFNLGSLSLFLTTSIRLLFLFKKIKLIHLPCTSNSGVFGYFFPLIKKIFGIPYIIQFHGGGMRPWKKYDGNRLLFKHATKVIVVSDTIKTEYEKRTGRDIEVILPLVPFTKSKKPKNQLKINYGFSENDKVIVMVGSIKPLKGNIWVYEEYKLLTKDYLEKTRLKLLFIGEGSDSGKLKKMIEQDKMEHWVRIIDRIPNETIHEIYGLADYYIIGSDFEGTPKSLLEAMFNSLPIIGTDVNGINSILINRENGLLVNKTSTGKLANSIMELVDNNQVASSYGKMAYETYQEKFEFSMILKRLTSIYNENY